MCVLQEEQSGRVTCKAESDLYVPTLSIVHSSRCFPCSCSPYLPHPDPRTAILFWLAISDLTLSTGYLLNLGQMNRDDNACTAQGVLLQFGGLSCCLWTAVMS